MKKICLSGIQPSGQLGIGHYCGAIKPWLRLQDEYQCILGIMDLHAITVPQEPEVLKQNTLDLLALYMACGLDPKKVTLFVQSHVPEHAQLSWVLNCFAHMGELGRMTQYKDKSQKHGEAIPVGLFDYPVLMAADILLYEADIVPVGEDQKQHVELTRDLAQRFNHRFKQDVLKVPEFVKAEVGAKIMSLQDPIKKMSKSDENQQSYLALLDPPSVLLKKIKRAVTDSEGIIAYDPENRAGVSNLLTLLQVMTGEPMDALVASFEGQGYGALKQRVADAVIACFEPIQDRYQALITDRGELDSILQQGAVAARERASVVLDKVHSVMGLL